MSYGRRPFYIIEPSGSDGPKTRQFEFFTGHSVPVSVRRDEIAQLAAALEERGELADLLARGRAIRANPEGYERLP